MSVLPSPVKSPGVGMSPAPPKTPAMTCPFELLEYHHSAAAPGRKIEISDLWSPSKSKGVLLTVPIDWQVTLLTMETPSTLTPVDPSEESDAILQRNCTL